MPGRIIDIIALREDFDPWLPNIEKNINYEMFFFDSCSLFSLGERKKNLAIVISTDRLRLKFEYKSRINMPRP